MGSLLSFLIWAALIIFMVRAGFDAHSIVRDPARHLQHSDSNRQARSEFRWVPPEKDIDPVCAKTVTTAKAKPSVHAGLVYYFCSRECREVFEAAPNLYVGHRPASLPELEHSHA
jgi:YHS domain-containing protein